jgi:hypothetical protein
MNYLRQGTASQEVIFSKAVDDTDGTTAETGLTIANTDIRIFKSGSATPVNKNSGGATHQENGYYSAVFDATDTDTVGSGKAVINVAGALEMSFKFTVLPQQVYDSLVAGTDLLDIEGSGITANADYYEGGAVYLDTNNGTAGTTLNTNGTVNNPTNLPASAITIATAGNYKKFGLVGASAWTLAAALQNSEVFGSGYSLGLGSQNIDKTIFYGASVTGVGSTASAGDRPAFVSCSIGASTLPPCSLSSCPIDGTVVIGAAGNYDLNDCQSLAARTIDFNSVGNVTMLISNHDGDLDLTGLAAGDVVNIFDCKGAISFTGAAGTINIRGGNVTATNNSAGSVTVNDLGTSGLTAAGIRAEMDSNSTQLAAIVEDTNEIQTDLANGGRTDLLIDSIITAVTAMKADLDNGGRLDLIFDAILADTNATRSDLGDGGRLDLLIDSIVTLGNNIETDTQAIQSALAGTLDANITQVGGNATALSNFLASLLTMVPLTVAATGNTTTVINTTQSALGVNVLANRWVYVRSGSYIYKVGKIASNTAAALTLADTTPLAVALTDGTNILVL